jgi:hypothetical protein
MICVSPTSQNNATLKSPSITVVDSNKIGKNASNSANLGSSVLTLRFAVYFSSRQRCLDG